MSASNQSLERWVAKWREQQLDLALEHRGAERHVEVRLAEVAVPLGDLVLEDQVVAERVPGQLADLAVVLVRVVAAVGEDRRRARRAPRTPSNQALIASPW